MDDVALGASCSRAVRDCAAQHSRSGGWAAAVRSLTLGTASLGVEAEPGVGSVVISWEGRSMILAVALASQVTGAKAQQLIGDHDSAGVVVADRITADARALLTASGWSWLDLRGHLHLRGPGLLVDTAVPAQGRPAVRVQPPIRGKAGLAVAYWLCAHPGTAMSPTGSAGELGFAPSTLSTAASALADARRYGLARPGTGEAAVAVAPVRQVVRYSGESESGWRLAPKLAVALQLATDVARGREILHDWLGDDHVWL
ncbi:MAG: hypothetical protein NVS3B26_15200 [Mycobacteriales bacterium]